MIFITTRRPSLKIQSCILSTQSWKWLAVVFCEWICAVSIQFFLSYAWKNAKMSCFAMLGVASEPSSQGRARWTSCNSTPSHIFRAHSNSRSRTRIVWSQEVSNLKVKVIVAAVKIIDVKASSIVHEAKIVKTNGQDPWNKAAMMLFDSHHFYEKDFLQSFS